MADKLSMLWYNQQTTQVLHCKVIALSEIKKFYNNI